jgi:hypothetical protein
MPNSFPHFKFHHQKSQKKTDCIELNGEVIYTIEDVYDFYTALGYTSDIAKEGILPEEYIWEKFTKNSKKRCVCLELKIINYLGNKSVYFDQLCKSNYKYWGPLLALAKLGQNAICSDCKMD